MYIDCPNCNTNFIVSQEQIGRSGRQVKCSKCYHIWYQRLDDILESTNSKRFGTYNITPLIQDEFHKANTINVPTLLPVKVPQYSYILPIVWLSLMILLSVMLFHDSFTIRSLFQHKNLTIDNIYVENINQTNKVRIFYRISNASDQTMLIPLIRVRLLDNKQSIIKSYLIDQLNIILASKQYINVKTELSSVPFAAQQLDIALGSRLDFILSQ